MKYYTVEQVSKAIGKSPETVRRLLRNSDIMLSIAKPTSSKSGWKIPEDALIKFLEKYPKYMTNAAKELLSSTATLPLIAAVVSTVVSLLLLNKSKKVTSEMVQNYIKEELSKNEKIVTSKNKTIEKKKEEIAKLQAEIDSLNLELTEAQTEVEKYSFALEQLDFNEIAESINKELDK